MDIFGSIAKSVGYVAGQAEQGVKNTFDSIAKQHGMDTTITRTYEPANTEASQSLEQSKIKSLKIQADNAENLAKEAAKPQNMIMNTLKAMPGSAWNVVDTIGRTAGAVSSKVLDDVAPGVKEIYSGIKTGDWQPYLHTLSESSKMPEEFIKDSNGKLRLNPGWSAKAQDIGLGTIGEDFVAKEIGTVLKPAVETALTKVERILKEGQQQIVESKKKSFGKVADKALTELYDSAHPISKLVTDVEKKTGSTLSADENAYIAARIYKASSGKIQQWTSRFGNILKETKKDGTALSDLSSYLFAQRSAERADRGFSNPGELTAEESRAALTEMSGRIGSEAFAKVEAAAQRIYGYADDMLQYMKDGGLLSQEQIDGIKKNNQKYTPFDVIEHLIDNETIVPANRRGFNVAEQDLVQTLKGAAPGQRVDDPLNAFVRKAIKMVDQVERNKVAMKVGDMVKRFGEDIKDFATIRASDKTSIPKGFDKISYLRDGVKEQVILPQDVADAMKRLSAKQADMITRAASFWTRALRSGATSMNVAFIVPNSLRDFETATLVNKDGFNIVDLGRGLFESIKSVATEYGVKVDDGLYQSYLKDGGSMGGYYSTYLNEIPRTVEELTQSNARKLLSLLNPLKLIETAGQISERSTRLGVYGKALSKGKSGIEAAFQSREATVDFAKMGETGKILNLWVPFLNARLQGEVNIMKSIGHDIKDPARAAWLGAKIGGLAIVPFLASYYNNVYRFPEVWNDIADYEKANNIILIYGNHQDDSGAYDQVIKMPKGDWNYFIDPIQDVMNWMVDKNVPLFNTLASDSLMDFVPLTTVQGDTFAQSLGGSLVNTFPTEIKAPVQWMTNFDLYRMQPIVPKSMENASPREQYKPYTSLIAQKLGSLLNLSPLQIQDAVQTLMGGAGTQALNLAGTVEKPGMTLPFTAAGERFMQARGGASTKKADEDIAKFQTQMADRNVIETRTAQNAFNALRKASSDAEAQKILDDIKSNPRIVSKLKTLIEDAAKNTTFAIHN